MDRKVWMLGIAVLLSGMLYVSITLMLEYSPEPATAEVKPTASECDSDKDCGVSGYTGDYTCRENSIYGEYIVYMCAKQEGLSKCIKVRSMEFVESCTDGEECIQGLGECQRKTTTTTTIKKRVEHENPGVIATTTTLTDVTCFRDSNCGLDHYGNPYCTTSGHSVRDYINYTCQNPGTYSSKCIKERKTYLVDYCGFGEACIRGECVDKNRLEEYCLREDCCATDYSMCEDYPVKMLPFPIRGENETYTMEHNTTIYL